MKTKTKIQIIDERAERLRGLLRVLAAQRKLEIAKERRLRKWGEHGK